MNIQIENKKYDVIEYNEKFSFDITGRIFNVSNIRNMDDNYATFKIERNLSNDTFNLKLFSNYYNSGSHNVIPYFNVDNRYEASSLINQALYNQVFNMPNNRIGYEYWQAHRSLFNNIELHKTSQIAASYNFTSDFKSSSVLLSYVVSPHFEPLNNNFVIPNENTIIKFKSLKEASFYMKDLSWPMGESKNLDNKNVDVLYRYNYIYVVPHKIEFGIHNSNLYDIYLENENNFPITNDYLIEPQEFNSSSLTWNGIQTTNSSGSLNTSFDLQNESKNVAFLTDNGTEIKNITRLGTISISSHTYYDYSVHKTVRGFSSESKLGEIIPFNFKGDYLRDTKLTLNSVFKNIHLQMAQKIENPLLSPYDGLVKLVIEQNTDQDYIATNLKEISFDNYKIIISEKNNFSFNALQRLSNEI